MKPKDERRLCYYGRAEIAARLNGERYRPRASCPCYVCHARRPLPRYYVCYTEQLSGKKRESRIRGFRRRPAAVAWLASWRKKTGKRSGYIWDRKRRRRLA